MVFPIESFRNRFQPTFDEAACRLLADLWGDQYETRARALLAEFGSLFGLANASAEQLEEWLPAREVRQVLAAFQLSRMVAVQKTHALPCDSPEAVYSLLAPSMQDLDREMCVAVLLNTKNRLIKICETGLGSLNESICHPREILRPAIIHQAYCFVFAHNHPSGDPRPSAADEAFTRKLAPASKLLHIPLIDHVIIGRPGSDQTGIGYFSFKAAGLL